MPLRLLATLRSLLAEPAPAAEDAAKAASHEDMDGATAAAAPGTVAATEEVAPLDAAYLAGAAKLAGEKPRLSAAHICLHQSAICASHEHNLMPALFRCSTNRSEVYLGSSPCAFSSYS